MVKLRHLAMRCQNLERSRDFYEKVFGFHFVGWRPQGDSLDLSDGVNNITLLQYSGPPRSAAFEEGTEYIHFGVIVDGIEECWTRCRQWGARISKDDVKDRTDVNPNSPPERSFKVLDPDGNVIDVTADHNEWRGVTV